MRLGIRAKEAVAVTLLTFLVVSTTTLVHLSHLSRVVAQEALRQAELIARQIYAQSRSALAAAPREYPADALARDRELRNLLESSVGYSPHLLYALVADRFGRVILHTEREREGQPAPVHPNLAALVDLDPVSRFRELYEGARTYEATLPLTLNEAPFGSIRLGVSSTLLRRELGASLRTSLTLAGIALPLAWLAAMGLAHLTLRPVRALAGEVDRIRRGEFSAGSPALSGGNEFQELSSQLQRLGQELHADRLATLSEKAHFQQVVDQLEHGVIFLSRELRILFFNKAAEEVMGRPLEQAVGAPIGDLLAESHPLRRLVEQALEDKGGFRNATLAMTVGDRRRECLVSAFPVEDAREVMGTVVLLKDLESIKTVQSLVSYSAKLAALGRLTSGIAHEVKNPLNAMTIHLELLKQKLEANQAVLAGATPKPVPAKGVDVHKHLNVIAQEIRRLDEVMMGFLKFARPDELKLQPVQLADLIADIAATVGPEAEKNRVTVRMDCSPALPEINADPGMLRQAILNLALNACQAMPDGGTLRLACRSTSRKLVEVDVEDTGVGIPPENLSRIFDLYFTTKEKGSGIGLSMVYRIVQLHDGEVEVESTPGSGTRFRLIFPQA